MKIIALIVMLLIMLSSSLVFAHKHNFDETKQLIDSGISCDKLTDEQLESIGDYYMEQMHPGDAHELMDQMMGGEGSDQLRQAHIAMAGRWYCGDTSGTRYGMMGAFDGASYGGMMDGFNGMMGGTMNMMGGGMMMGG